MRSLTLDALLRVSTESIEYARGGSSVAVFTLSSNCELPVAYQVIPSDTERYRAQPALGLLNPFASIAVHVDLLVKADHELDTTTDLIRVFCTWVEEPTRVDLETFWERIAPAEIQSHSVSVAIVETLSTPPTNVSKMVCKLPAVGDMWLNGLANEYDARFPPALAEYMTKEDFEAGMKLINEALIDHWPCVPCMSVGYGCCICTAGLSLYCAGGQIREAEEAAHRQIARLNRRPIFAQRNITWALKRVWYRHTSWIEITMQQA
ncbi:hypothetical protein ACHHYP_04510 [Achlya hypogyna]|uniref:MSP domain-containing protein n=1 Tax=Achlya hypogyna TaxID=1202772 RepID=A0A1V9Z108_ACHHY|nr:hypothetical protein ACHHYP_04510 [Achlya hypogyna]